MKFLPFVERKKLAICGECLARFTEGAKRQPCPKCGSMGRLISRSVSERLGAKDRAA